MVPLPDFVIIGAQKSATRWLRFNLGLHPDVFTAPNEVKYFNHPLRMAELGLDWYRSHFEGWSNRPIVGEATPGYMMLRHGPADVAERIADTLPGVRLIALLRNPVDRAGSALLHHRRLERIHPSVGLLERVRSVGHEEDWLGLVSGGLYAASLAPYLDLFGERLAVFLYDDVLEDPARLYRSALDHIGAAATFEPESLRSVLRSNQPADGMKILPDERGELFGFFADDVERLEQMLSLDLSRWRP